MYYGENNANFDPDRINIRSAPFIKVVSDPYIMQCCRKGDVVKAYTSEFARLVGPDMQVTECDEWAAERALLGYSTNRTAKSLAGRVPMTGALYRMGGQQPALNSVIGRSAVLVKDVGAVCAGRTEADAEDIAAAVSRNCSAACNQRYEKPLGAVDARIKRYMYLIRNQKGSDK